MLDVITVVSESTPKSFVNECRASLHRAVEFAGYSVRLIETPGVPGNIGKAMQGGLELSRAPYVAWVDDDDFVLPNAFACLQRHFATAPAAIFAREIGLLASGRLVPHGKRHHLTAFRRDVLDAMPMHEYATHTSTDMREFAEAAGPCEDEWSWVYVYRMRRSPGEQLRAGVSNGRDRI